MHFEWRRYRIWDFGILCRTMDIRAVHRSASVWTGGDYIVALGEKMVTIYTYIIKDLITSPDRILSIFTLLRAI